MKKNKIITIKFLVVLLLVLSTGCSEEFFNINNNPNNPPRSTPSLSLPVAQQELVDLNSKTMNYLGQFMVYNWTTPSNWSANEELITYDISANFYGSIFERSYSKAFKNLVYIDNFEDPNGTIDYSFYKAASNILKAYQYQYLVDLYGDIPYFEAGKRGNNPTPKYDKAEEIYKDLIKNVTSAVETLSNLPSNAENPGAQDIMFKGDALKWQKFANTIKLRLLIRLSNTNQDSFITSEIAKIKSNGKGFITENVYTDPGYTDNDGKMSPFYGWFIKPNSGDETTRKDFTVATDHTLKIFMDNHDERYKRIYAKAQKGGYKGAEQSTILPGTGFTSKDLSKVGPGLLKSASQKQPLMLLSEALFLQAEAIQRGYMSGDAKSMYNKGIEESFVFLGVPAIEEDLNATPPIQGKTTIEIAQEYHSQNIPNVSYDFTSDKLQAIITQKWLALNSTSGIESWIEYNRTGYPLGLPIPSESKQSNRPYRLLYPSSEISRNSNNVPKQSSNDAFTKKIFWQK